MILKNAKQRFEKLEEHPLWEKLSHIIQTHHSFIITTHILPDGDGLGGEVALSAYIKQIGKECIIINGDPTPEKFSIVDPDFEIKQWNPKEPLPKAQVIFAVDVNDWKRLGPLTKALEQLKAKSIFIDHHIADEQLKQEHIIDERTSSMGEFLFQFFKYIEAEITFKMALAMYVSIFTDTNAFRHRKTTALSHAICAALVETGVNPALVTRQVHQTRSLADLHILGEILKTVQTTPDGKIAWIVVSQALQKKYGATSEETQGMVDYLLALKEIEVGIFFREEPDGTIAVSFRSKGKVEIFPLVKKLGGGGHAYEAGVLIRKGTLQEVVQRVLAEAQKFI
ncbi:MAG: bifunctional oligoribonuclease/PAP phosphatase NrnA [Deltaproteobacteria bacterium]|nr:bifunctional oligoribonuclease/PAP phosphatase NrnA [Deltaproteobacteria bacterium]